MRILIAEDDPVSRRLLETTLLKWRYEVVVTTDGQAALENFEYFLKLIQEVVKRDFPGVELKILKRGESFRLPDRTRLNVQNLQPQLGYVLSAPGKKHRVLSGVQSDADFACAAAAFFQRSSSACPSSGSRRSTGWSSWSR